MLKEHHSPSVFQKQLINKKLNSPLGYLILFIFSVVFVLILKIFGELGGIIAFVILIGLPLSIICVFNATFGYILALVFAFFMFTLSKVGIELPTGVVYDFIFFVTLGGIILKEIVYKKSDWSGLKTPIFITLFVLSAYEILQVLNPNAVSTYAYLYGMRGLATKFCILIVGLYVIQTFAFVKLFTKVWLALALLAALYSMKQEFLGFFDFERSWVMADEGRYRLIFIWGRFRKWSFLSDVNAFGLLMAFSSIFCFISVLGPYKKTIKVILFISGICMLMGMTFSGTRTAYAMVPAGFSLYILMTLKDIKTVVFTIVMALAFAVVLFGPFYGGNLNRIRSLIRMEEDPSMNVRDVNRDRIQPYLLSHPIGGGLVTTGAAGREYSPGHPLAGFPPDSGYLETALETGWIGLILEMIFLSTVLIVGLRNFFRTKDPTIKNFYAAYLCSFFALTVANYAQDSLGQKPIGLIVYTTFILMFKLKEMDNEIQNNNVSSS